MDEMTCPQCSSTMSAHQVGDAIVHRCESCSGVFLARADLGVLAEAENDWHLASSRHTQPLPRITEDMAAPPASRPSPAGSFVETLFGDR